MHEDVLGRGLGHLQAERGLERRQCTRQLGHSAEARSPARRCGRDVRADLTRPHPDREDLLDDRRRGSCRDPGGKSDGSCSMTSGVVQRTPSGPTPCETKRAPRRQARRSIRATRGATDRQPRYRRWQARPWPGVYRGRDHQPPPHEGIAAIPAGATLAPHGSAVLRGRGTCGPSVLRAVGRETGPVQRHLAAVDGRCRALRTGPSRGALES